jgi:predicted metal-dependent peptidase
VRAVFEAAHADVTWVQCDAAIAEVLTLTSVADIDRITLKGGGGTDFRPPFALVDKLPDSARPQVMVYVTDGQGTAPTYAPSYKVIWALLGGSVAPASWGTAVLIPREG